MTIIEKGPSKVQTPSPSHRPGTSKGDTRRESRSIDVKGKSGKKESDLISSATSALRRLNFRSAGGSHPKRATASAPAGQNGSPLQQTSSSTTSETTTINTSIESANTVYTMITVTDAEQEDKGDQDLLESKAILKEEMKSKECSEGKDQTQRAEKKPEIRSKTILNEFDKLIQENQKLLNAEKSKKTTKNGAKFHQGIGAAAGGGGVGGSKKGTTDQKKPVKTVTIQDKADKGKFKKLDWPLKKGKQSALDDKHTKTTKTSAGFLRVSSLERGSDKTVSNEQQKPAYAPGASPPTSMFPQEQAYFLTPCMIGEDAIQDYDFMDENEKFKEIPKEKMDKPKSHIKVIQSELPQRTFSTNFNKRKKVGDLEDRRKSEVESDGMPYSATTSPKPKITDDTRFPFPPRSNSPIKVTRSSSPRVRRDGSTSLKKLSDAPIAPITDKNETTTKKKTALFPFMLSNLEQHEMQVSEEVQQYRSNFGSILDVTSSPLEEGFDASQMTSSSNTQTGTSPSETNIKDAGKAFADETIRISHKRKKRHDRKSTSLETSDEDTKFVKTRNSRDAFLSSLSERNVGSPQNRKYSILATDGTIKNFISETSDEFKKSGENINKENIKKKKTARRSSECPQRHRRVSIIQGESLRHFIFEEPDTSRMKPSKQRKVSKVIEDTTRSLLLEDVHPRKSSLVPSETMKSSMGEESPRKSSIVPDDKPRKFSINTLGDIVSARKFSLLPPGEIYTSQVDGKTTEVIKLAPVSKGKPLATIVVQQASIQRGSISGPSNQREDTLNDLVNTFTLEELHEFDMKYGSPHHCRSQSVKTPGRSCGRPNYLCLPQQRARVASMPNTGVEEEYYRLRHFSITGKGLVNRGDSLKSRRSRSNTSVASSNSSHSTDHLGNNACAVGSYPGTARNSAECSLASSRDSSTTCASYNVVLLGSDDVGKTSLISQFMSSDYFNAYEESLDEEEGEKSVSVLLNNEESELTFFDHPSSELKFDNGNLNGDAHGYIIVYSVVDRESFQIAEQALQCLWRNESIGTKAVILVGNKGDLARSRTVTYDEGRDMANAYDCKFIETSVGINHNVDQLLAGIVSQIRLKNKRAAEAKKNLSPFGRDHSPKRWRNTRLSASVKVKGLLDDEKDGKVDDVKRIWQEVEEIENILQNIEELIMYNNYQEQWLGGNPRMELDSDDSVDNVVDQEVNNADLVFDDYIHYYGIDKNVVDNTRAKAKDKKKGKRAYTTKKRAKVSKTKRVKKDKKNDKEIIFFSLDFDRSFIVRGQNVETLAKRFKEKSFTPKDLLEN